MALVEVTVPDIGDFDEVAVIEVLVKPGDSVRQSVDGNPVFGGWRGQNRPSQIGRQDQAGVGGVDLGERCGGCRAGGCSCRFPCCTNYWCQNSCRPSGTCGVCF